MDARVTIIVPCYNVENYIDRCMESIMNQSIGVSSMQILLIDDASTDGTMDKLLRWQECYPTRIQIIHNRRNRRQGTCRNLGIQHAIGEYVLFVDADDWIEPDMCEKMLTVADIGECDIVACDNCQDTEFRYCKTLREKYTGKIDRLIRIENEEERCKMIVSNLLGTYVVTKLYRRSFLEKNQMRFPEDVIFEDIYWMGLLNCYVVKIGLVEERLYHYFMNPDSVSRARNREENKDICKVNKMLWEVYQERGLLEGELKEALSFELLCTYYLTAAKMIFLRYDDIPYDFFYEVQKDILQMVPEYYSNEKIVEYINHYSKDFNILLLGLIDKELTHEHIDSAADSMRILAKQKSVALVVD